jgi:predicted RNA-binding Zn ribbon-like protein
MKDFDGLPMVGGHPALDFLNTVEFRGAAEPGDRLSTYDGLARWSTAVGLISQQELTRISLPGIAGSLRAARAWRAATELREALYAVVIAHIRTAPLPRDAHRLVEKQMRNASVASSLRYAEGGLGFSWHVSLRHPEDIAARLADSANNLLLSLGSVAVHQCGGPNCDWLFIDRSHGHRRLWCQPSKCGNVVRVRRSRSR